MLSNLAKLNINYSNVLNLFNNLETKIHKIDEFIIEINNLNDKNDIPESFLECYSN